jgi:hypothetical protein
VVQVALAMVVAVVQVCYFIQPHSTLQIRVRSQLAQVVHLLALRQRQQTTTEKQLYSVQSLQQAVAQAVELMQQMDSRAVPVAVLRQLIQVEVEHKQPSLDSQRM